MQIPHNGVGLLPTGRTYKVDSDVWIEIIYRGKKGWVNSKFVKAVGGEASESAATAIPFTAGVKVKAAAKEDELNLRAEASGSSAVLVRLPSNATDLTATGRARMNGADQWIEVRYKKHVGWLHRRLIRIIPESDKPALVSLPKQAARVKPSNDLMVDCNSESDLRKLAGCSSVIATMNVSGLELAIAYSRRSDAYLAAQDFDNAIADRAAACKQQPEDPGFNQRLAFAYRLRAEDRRVRGDLDGATADFTEAIRLHPKNYELLAGRSAVSMQKSDHDRAIADLETACNLEQADPRCRSSLARLYGHRGTTYLRGKDFDRAIADFTKAIELEPKHESLLLLRAAAHEGNKQIASALADYASAKAINPENVSTYIRLGALSSALGQHAAAIAHLDDAIKRNSANVTALMMRGLAFEEARQPDRAVENYRAVIKLKPSHKIAKASLARVSETQSKANTRSDAITAKTHESDASLKACCIAYCRLIECNSPPLPKACSASILAQYTAYMSVIEAKKNFVAGAKNVLRGPVSIPECK